MWCCVYVYAVWVTVGALISENRLSSLCICALWVLCVQLTDSWSNALKTSKLRVWRNSHCFLTASKFLQKPLANCQEPDAICVRNWLGWGSWNWNWVSVIVNSVPYKRGIEWAVRNIKWLDYQTFRLQMVSTRVWDVGQCLMELCPWDNWQLSSTLAFHALCLEKVLHGSRWTNFFSRPQCKLFSAIQNVFLFKVMPSAECRNVQRILRCL